MLCHCAMSSSLPKKRMKRQELKYDIIYYFGRVSCTYHYSYVWLFRYVQLTFIFVVTLLRTPKISPLCHCYGSVIVEEYINLRNPLIIENILFGFYYLKGDFVFANYVLIIFTKEPKVAHTLNITTNIPLHDLNSNMALH